VVETGQKKSANRAKLVARDLALTHDISLPIASLDGRESLTCPFMAVPKVGSGHYDTLFLFYRHGIPLAADVRHLHEKVDSDNTSWFHAPYLETTVDVDAKMPSLGRGSRP